MQMAIDKLMKVAPVSLRPAQQGEKQPLVNMPIKTPKSQYDHENSRYFEKSVKMMVEKSLPDPRGDGLVIEEN